MKRSPKYTIAEPVRGTFTPPYGEAITFEYDAGEIVPALAQELALLEHLRELGLAEIAPVKRASQEG